MKTLCDECETAYLNNCECEEPCTHKEYYDEGYQQGRANAIDECIALARAEIDFESQAEQKRFVEFLKQLKERK